MEQNHFKFTYSRHTLRAAEIEHAVPFPLRAGFNTAIARLRRYQHWSPDSISRRIFVKPHLWMF